LGGRSTPFPAFHGPQQEEGGAFVMVDGEPFGLLHVPPGERLGDAPVRPPA
jgi:hypothetical protein